MPIYGWEEYQITCNFLSGGEKFIRDFLVPDGVMVAHGPLEARV